MKPFLIIVLVFSILWPGFMLAQDVHSRWVKTPVVIDGDPSEWPQPFRYYDGNTKLQFTIANDTANIYVCLKITDEPTQMKLFRAGLYIWVDPKGKRKQASGINFPMKPTTGSASDMPRQQDREQAQIPGQSYQKHDFNQMKARMIAHQQTIKLTGFFNVPDQVAPLKNTYGMNVAFGWDSFNILCIEYQIPIALTLKHPLVASDTVKPIGLGFIENALEGVGGEHRSEGGEGKGGGGWGGSESGRGGGMGGGGMSGGGMGGMGRGGGGGMGHGGGGYNSGSGYNSANQEQKLWVKLILTGG